MNFRHAGGTADITVHEKLSGGKLKEIHSATGGGWGGTTVNSSFFQFLIKLIGGPAVNLFKTKYKPEYLDLFREFETSKRNISTKSSGKISLRAPVNLNEACKEKNHGEDIKTILQDSNCPFKDTCSWLGDKIQMDAEVMKGFFKTSTTNIIGHIRGLLADRALEGISLMLL